MNLYIYLKNTLKFFGESYSSNKPLGGKDNDDLGPIITSDTKNKIDSQINEVKGADAPEDVPYCNKVLKLDILFVVLY